MEWNGRRSTRRSETVLLVLIPGLFVHSACGADRPTPHPPSVSISIHYSEPMASAPSRRPRALPMHAVILEIARGCGRITPGSGVRDGDGRWAMGDAHHEMG